MTLIDRLRNISPADLARDVREFFGNGFAVSAAGVHVGNELIPLAELRDLEERLGVVHQPQPARIRIDDLPGAA